MPDVKDNKTQEPLKYYRELYEKADPEEISARCQISFDKDKSLFAMRLMGEDFTVTYPYFTMLDKSGKETKDYPAYILIMRYMLEGTKALSSGRDITYREVPWGETYYTQFNGRCMLRLAYSFGYKIDAFCAAMEQMGASRESMGDASYKIEFMDGLYVTLIIWGADEEFDPNTQILFSDNFPRAFSAEDLAFVGDLIINKLKATDKLLSAK